MRKLGDYGEQLAIQFLRDKGYQIITTNWHCPYGELDIVAWHNQVLVIVEVKTRRSRRRDDALSALTDKKRERLLAAAYAYLAAHDLEQIAWRVDAIGITLPHGKEPQIEHVEDALEWE